MSAGVSAVRRAVLADAAPARLGIAWWLIVLCITVGTNLIDVAVLPRAEAGSGDFIAIAVMRVLVLFAAAFAIVRRVMRTRAGEGGWRAFPRFLALSIVLAIGYTMTQKIAAVALGEGSLANRWLAMLIVSAFWSILLIRTTAWSAALAAGRRFRVLPSLWAGLSGKWPVLAIVYLQLILPLVAIDLALGLLATELVLPADAKSGLALIDAVIGAVQLVLTAALAHAALVLADRP